MLSSLYSFMKTRLSKTEAKQKVNDFFKQKSFSQEGAKKIKRLAMKYNLKLSQHRKKFCKSCLNPLKGKTRITKTHKTVECESCGHKNKFRL